MNGKDERSRSIKRLKELNSILHNPTVRNCHSKTTKSGSQQLIKCFLRGLPILTLKRSLLHKSIQKYL